MHIDTQRNFPIMIATLNIAMLTFDVSMPKSMEVNLPKEMA